MKSKTLGFLSILAVALSWTAAAQTYDTNGVYVQTFAGSGFYGWVDGVGELTMFNGPSAIVTDSSNNLFVFDTYNLRIREITTNATVSTFCGGGNQASGCGAVMSLPECQTMTIDNGNVLWAPLSQDIYQVEPDGCGEIYFDLDGGSFSPIPTPVCSLGGMCVDSESNIYFSDRCGQKIYRFSHPGPTAVFVGSGNIGAEDGNGIFTSFNSPTALAADAAGNIYVWDSGNGVIRRIDQNRNVVTIAGKFDARVDSDGVGTNASFSTINSMCVDGSGNLILACNSSIREINAATNVQTIAGSFTQSGYTNGPGSVALFAGAAGVCVSRGSIFVADAGNQRIRQITFNSQAKSISSASLGIATYPGLTITGVVGRTYEIQTSPDMNTWSTVATLLLNSNPYLWIDQNGVIGNKFYRAVLLP
jgi:hypothetical protein